MNKEIVKLTEDNLREIIREGVRMALSDERKQLNEMARVGFFDDYEVYVHTNDPGHIPHFHLRDSATQGKIFETCIELKRNKYFHHGYHQGVLNSKERKVLAKFMESVNEHIGKTNYEVTCILWNMNNSDYNIDLHEVTTIPDYTNIED